MAACVMGRSEVIRTLIFAGAKIYYEKGGKVFNAIDAARYHPKIVHWFLVDQDTEKGKICDGKDTKDYHVHLWSGIVQCDITEIPGFKKDSHEPILEYLKLIDKRTIRYVPQCLVDMVVRVKPWV